MKAKAWEEKFSKLKDVYQKLRDEHISLLRQKADSDKKLSASSAALEESTKIQCELQDSLQLARVKIEEADSELNSLSRGNEEKIKQLNDENQQLREAKENMMVSSVCRLLLFSTCI